MSVVRFATKCDHCAERSPEYTAWPTCRECSADTCWACAMPATAEGGDGWPLTVRCKACWRAEQDIDRTAHDLKQLWRRRVTLALFWLICVSAVARLLWVAFGGD